MRPFAASARPETAPSTLPSSSAPTTITTTTVGDKRRSVTAAATPLFAPGAAANRRCVAVSTAPSYDLRRIDELFHGSAGPRSVHRSLPYVHVVNPMPSSESGSGSSGSDVDIFFFAHGSFVAWGTTPAQDKFIIDRLAGLSQRGGGGSGSGGGVMQQANAAEIEREEYTWLVADKTDIDTKRDALVLAADEAHIKVCACVCVCATQVAIFPCWSCSLCVNVCAAFSSFALVHRSPFHSVLPARSSSMCSRRPSTR